MQEINFMETLHSRTKRDYTERIVKYDKGNAAEISCKFGKDTFLIYPPIQCTIWEYFNLNLNLNSPSQRRVRSQAPAPKFLSFLFLSIYDT